MGGIFSDIGDFLLGGDDELMTEQLATMTPEQQAQLRRMFNVLDVETGHFGPSNVFPSNNQLNKDPTALEQLSLEGLDENLRNGFQADQQFQNDAKSMLLGQINYDLGNLESFDPTTSATGALNRTQSASTALKNAPTAFSRVGDAQKELGKQTGTLDQLSSQTGAFDTVNNLFANNDMVSATDDFFNRTIQEPALDEFERVILPRISRSFSQDFFGSDRQRADSRAREDLIDSLSAERGKLSIAAAQQDFEQDKVALGAKETDLAQLIEASEGDLGRFLETLLGSQSLGVQAQTADNSLLVDAATSDRNILANAAAADARTELGGYQVSNDFLLGAANTQHDAVRTMLGVEGLNLEAQEQRFDEILGTIDWGGLPRRIQDQAVLFDEDKFRTTEERQNAKLQLILQALNAGAVENVAGVSEGGSGLISDFLSGGGAKAIAEKFI